MGIARECVTQRWTILESIRSSALGTSRLYQRSSRSCLRREAARHFETDRRRKVPNRPAMVLYPKLSHAAVARASDSRGVREGNAVPDSSSMPTNRAVLRCSSALNTSSYQTRKSSVVTTPQGMLHRTTGSSRIAENTSLAAFAVDSISLSPCTEDTNAASNCDGGSHTPRSSMPR